MKQGDKSGAIAAYQRFLVARPFSQERQTVIEAMAELGAAGRSAPRARPIDTEAWRRLPPQHLLAFAGSVELSTDHHVEGFVFRQADQPDPLTNSVGVELTPTATPSF